MTETPDVPTCVRCSSGKRTSSQLDNATTAINYAVDTNTMFIHYVRGFQFVRR